jgi:hypothetical protein
MLMRNALLGALAAVALVTARGSAGLARLDAPEARDLLPVVLAGLGLVLALWMVHAASTAMRGREPS